MDLKSFLTIRAGALGVGLSSVATHLLGKQTKKSAEKTKESYKSLKNCTFQIETKKTVEENFENLKNVLLNFSATVGHGSKVVVYGLGTAVVGTLRFAPVLFLVPALLKERDLLL